MFLAVCVLNKIFFHKQVKTNNNYCDLHFFIYKAGFHKGGGGGGGGGLGCDSLPPRTSKVSEFFLLARILYATSAS